MAKIPQEIIDDVVRRSDMLAVVGRYTQLRKQGSRYVGLCPFHSEKTPSFGVTPERGVFKCFGCGEGGGLLQFLMKAESLNFVETVQKLGSEVGVEVRIEERNDPEELARKRSLELLERCSHYYHDLLLKSPLGQPALEYLKARGLSLDTVKRFRLGWAPPTGQALLQKLQASGYSMEEGDAVGVLRMRNGRASDTLRGRVVFPICDVQDRVIAFGGRVLDGETQPKYLNTPETALYSKRRNLYGLNLHRNEISKQDKAVVVEGYLDVVSLHEVGAPLAVASLGTALTQEQTQLLRRYTRNVVLAYDADRAGQAATFKGIELFEEVGLRVQIAGLAAGEDPDSVARKHGKEGIEQMVDQAVGVIDFLIAVNEERFDLSSPEGKEDFAREVLPALEKISDRVRRDAYVVRVARRLGVNETQIHWRLASKRQGTVLARRRGKIDSRIPEARLFRVCVYHPEWFDHVRSRMSPDTITSDRLRPLFAALWNVQRSDQPLQLQDLAPHIEDPEALEDLTELLMEPPPISIPADAEKLVEDLYRKWELSRLEHLRREVVPALDAGTITGEDERVQEYFQLQKRLKGAR